MSRSTASNPVQSGEKVKMKKFVVLHAVTSKGRNGKFRDHGAYADVETADRVVASLRSEGYEAEHMRMKHFRLPTPCLG